MQKIRLRRGEWWFDFHQRLGSPGSFGEVFLGGRPGDDTPTLAVKRFRISAKDKAHRELKIADELAGRTLVNVIPFLDSGIDTESDDYFVVMARAEKSLQDDLDNGARFDSQQAAGILLQLVHGLGEAPELVHRDMKPANVLLHEGKWKIADFGIARFIEDATTSETLMGCLSPKYAAPKQFAMLRATVATDIYAVGCIGFALLTGSPPFTGSRDELAQHHQNSDHLLCRRITILACVAC